MNASTKEMLISKEYISHDLSVKSEHLLAIRAISYFLDFALSQGAMPGKKLEVFIH